MTNKYYGNPLAWGGKQQPPAEARCTCPSGDGSLRWPCPAHPPEAQPAAWQFQDREGNWHGFINEQHRLNTIEDGSWPIRALYAHPPPSAPVGVEGLPERWRREAPQAKVDSGEDAARAYREAMHWCAFQLEEALAQQPAAVDGVWLRPVIKQGDYVAKWGFCNPEEPDAVCFFPSPQQGGES